VSVHDPLEAVLGLVTAARVRHDGPGPVVLGVDGRSGSGKSDLAGAVTAALRADGTDVALLALEDAYPGWDGLAAGVAAVARGVLAPLSRGEPGTVRTFDWDAARPGPVLRVPAPGRPVPDVLVVEGCGAGSAACAPYLDALVWLEAAEEVRRRRALERDDHTWTERWATWAAQEEALLAVRDARALADLVVRTG
jgi:predicted kinase